MGTGDDQKSLCLEYEGSISSTASIICNGAEIQGLGFRVCAGGSLGILLSAHFVFVV